MASLILRINEGDNVAVALADISAGTPLALPDGTNLTAATDVPYGHKLALVAIPAGGPVVKYGEPIGLAARDIEPGEWVHTQHLAAPDAPAGDAGEGS